MNKNFCFLVYTNENYLPIADLTIGEFDRFFPENTLNRYVVSNSFKDYEFENKNAIFINTETKFDGSGAHFGSTMTSALNNIKEDYILFFCDDYLLIDKPNINYLVELMDIIVRDNIDFFSFSSNRPKPTWEKYQINSDKLPNREFYYMPENFHYLYSVQPCIWKKSSLLEILKHNPELSVHALDTANIINREGYRRVFDPLTDLWNPYPHGTKGYGFKCISTDYEAYDEISKFEYFIFPYVEIIRHGFFNLSYETNTKKFLLNLIEERKINKNNHLKKFIL